MLIYNFEPKGCMVTVYHMEHEAYIHILKASARCPQGQVMLREGAEKRWLLVLDFSHFVSK